MLTERNPWLVSRHAPSKQNAARVQERNSRCGNKNWNISSCVRQ